MVCKNEKCNNEFEKKGVRIYCSKPCRAYEEHKRNSLAYKEYRKEYYNKNKEYYAKKHKDWLSKNKEVARFHKMKATYGKFGFTKELYEKMLVESGGRCAICSKLPTSKGLFLDHDHKSGKLRGLICSRCNTVLGMVNDDIMILGLAIKYLQR